MTVHIKLLNVGPKSAAWLRQVGIRSREQLVEAGTIATFIKVKRAGFRPGLNLLYALEGAICDCHWRDVPETRRAELIEQAEAASVGLFKTSAASGPPLKLVTTVSVMEVTSPPVLVP